MTNPTLLFPLADLLVRIRLCLAIACVGGYKSIDPNTIAAALCCLDRTVDGRVEAGKHALNPELQQVESPISDGQGVADGNEDLCWTDAARLAAGMAAERARRSALESGASNAEADELASAEYKAQLPLDLATGASTVILHSRGDWLGQAIQVVPFMAGVVSGEVHGAATQEVGAAAMEVFLHHVPLPGC